LEISALGFASSGAGFGFTAGGFKSCFGASFLA